MHATHTQLHKESPTEENLAHMTSYRQSSAFPAAVSEGYLSGVFLLETPPLPTVVLDRATLERGVPPPVLRGGEQTAGLQQLLENEERTWKSTTRTSHV